MTEKPPQRCRAQLLRWPMDVSPPVNAVPVVIGDATQSEGESVSGGTIRACIWGGCVAAFLLLLPAPRAEAQEKAAGGLLQLPGKIADSYSQRKKRIADLPMQRLTEEAQNRILSIANSPTLYRRLPAQAIDCDPEMFLFLSRKPEVLVGIWELMGITKVKTTRTGPYQFDAEDGSGTTCHIDLVYGDPNLHIYVAEGFYDGKLTAKPIHGRGVFVVQSSYAESSGGRTTVTGTIDCFVQIQSLGADLVARTLSGLIGRSADHNFTETARFIAQVSEASEHNPPAMIDVAKRMPQVDHATRLEFIRLISSIAAKGTRRGARTAALKMEERSQGVQ